MALLDIVVKGWRDDPHPKMQLMLCTWWVYICGSNVSGREQASLSTKADFALWLLFACTPSLHGPPTWLQLSFSPNTHELHWYQQLLYKRVKAMGSQSTPLAS